MVLITHAVLCSFPFKLHSESTVLRELGLHTHTAEPPSTSNGPSIKPQPATNGRADERLGVDSAAAQQLALPSAAAANEAIKPEPHTGMQALKRAAIHVFLITLLY